MLLQIQNDPALKYVSLNIWCFLFSTLNTEEPQNLWEMQTVPFCLFAFYTAWDFVNK